MTDPAPRRSIDAPPRSSMEGVFSRPQRSNSSTSIDGQYDHKRNRSSFAENLRSHPPSPRTTRLPSLTGASSVQELLSHPPNKGDSRFMNRDWREIAVGELVDKEDVHFIEFETPVEDATKLLVNAGSPNVILIRDSPDSKKAVSSFDYTDLCAYLLVVLGAGSPSSDLEVKLFDEIAQKARDGLPIPVKAAKALGRNEPLVTISENSGIAAAIESFGSGVHRILVLKEGTEEVVGILSQVKLVKFLWDNGTCFPVIDQLYPMILKDLNIGSRQVVSINGDKPLIDALQLMSSQSLSSLPVLDTAFNVIGNISVIDTRHLITSSSLPLLQSSCIHFISVILSERGVENGKDSFPVFHVNPYSTLAHTVAKLVATRAHRMWVVEEGSPRLGASGPPTPSTPHATPANPFSFSSSTPSTRDYPPRPDNPTPSAERRDSMYFERRDSMYPPTPTPSASTIPHDRSGSITHERSNSITHERSNSTISRELPGPMSPSLSSGSVMSPSFPSVSAAQLPGARISGRLTGVVSLSDVMNLFARWTGLNPQEPGAWRRRRSSSVSVNNGGGGAGNGRERGSFDLRR